MAANRKDVARRAGVSVAVVSYVVNNGPRPVAPDTRRRVLQAIAELEYRPSTVALHLKTGRSNAIGVVLPDLSLPHFGEMMQVLSELAFDRGQQLIIAATQWDLDAERKQLTFLAERRVDGVVLMSVDPLQDFEWLVHKGARVVVIDRPEAAVYGAKAATSHLIDHGHRRIGFVSGMSGTVAGMRRREGWAAALESHGLDRDDELIVVTGINQEGGYSAARRLLGRPNAPTGLFVDSDVQASGVLRAAAELGIGVPHDLAVVSGEGTAIAAYAVPSLTAVEVPRRAIALEALDALAESVEPELRSVGNSDFELVLRESCGPHPE